MIEDEAKPTVYLGTLEPNDRFYFRGDWQTDPGTYTVDEPLDGYVVVKEFKGAREQGLWFPNVSVVKI